MGFLFLIVVMLSAAILTVRALIWLWRRGRWGRIAILGASVFLGYNIYTAVHPLDSFYKDGFQDVSGLAFPRSGRIVCSHATYPDWHGDFEAWALFEVEPADFQKLEESLRASRNRDFSMGLLTDASLWERIGDASRFRFRTAYFDKANDEFKDWGTLEDGKSVVFRYVSWRREWRCPRQVLGVSCFRRTMRTCPISPTSAKARSEG